MNNFYNNSNKELIRLWGEKLKELRLEANLSQASLAEQAGLGRNSVAEIEKGRNFSVGSLIALLRVLNQLDRLEGFFQKRQYDLTPMEIFEREQKKRKRGGYTK
jgi:transcriptional regulator with XRE-family HTH domain